ncbi:MAG: hypothetical protein C5B49_03175 [Bdellovibrio sp.]|nr:MAG: hypothetical protein C5B49_03175 [Bdellovibrio sp.]
MTGSQFSTKVRIMKLRFTRHALERMFQRGISPGDCENVFRKGKVIEAYPEDKPFPSELRMAVVGENILHLVVCYENSVAHVITVYKPDPLLWENGFTKRRKK